MQHQHYPKAQPKDIEQVLFLLHSVYSLSDSLRNDLIPHLVSVTLQKEEVLIAEGATCQYMYFILTGALMGYATHKGKKIVTYVSVENEFVSSISGMHGMRPSKEGIMAVEPTTMIALPNTIIMGLFEKHFDFNYIFRVMVQKYYMDAQERAHIIRVGNARERYLYFIQTTPGFIDRIPLEYVASLLDVKPDTLARIKKQYSQSLKKGEDTAIICRRLEQYLIEHTPYRTKDLKLSDLARAIDITPHTLSSLLNNHYHLNFVDFINTYRINSIREQMMQPETCKALP